MNQTTKATTFVDPKMRFDLVMTLSDLELILRKMRSLEISYFRLKQNYIESTEMNVIDFEIDDFGTIIFCSFVSGFDEFVRITYDDGEGNFEEILQELRAI